MKTGEFINFNLLYNNISAKTQAKSILDKAVDLIAKGSKGVAITYSANYQQTYNIVKGYFAGKWNTQTNGANQAAVMYEMENLMETKAYEQLQGEMRIVPITTMSGGAYAELWNDDFHMGIVITDLVRIQAYLDGRWDVLGWQNQDTVDNSTHPYAIGGGIAHLPKKISNEIQTALRGYHKKYQ